MKKKLFMLHSYLVNIVLKQNINSAKNSIFELLSVLFALLCCKFLNFSGTIFI